MISKKGSERAVRQKELRSGRRSVFEQRASVNRKVVLL